MIAVRCFESIEQAAYLRDDADALNRLSERPDPFSTFAFIDNFIRHAETRAAGRRPWLLAAFRAERLVGYVALERSTRRVLGWPSAAIRFLVTHDTDRPHVVARREDLQGVSAAFYAYLLGRRREWSLLEFQQQDAGSALFPPPAGVDLGGHLVRQWPSLENGTVRVRWPTLPDYIQALPKKFRANLARQLQGLLAAGRVELLASSDPLSTPALFELCLGIEPRSWKAQAAATITRDPRRVDYFRSLLDARQPMRLSIHLLLLDGVPIAGLINGAFGDGLYALHIVHDEGFARFGPGSTMLLLGMREAIAGRCAFYNLLSGFGYYKSHWLAQITETRNMQIYRRGSLPYWHRLLGDCKRRLRRVAAPAAAPAAAPLHNPARRAVRDQGRGPVPTPEPAERERSAALIASARNGACEFLSAAELAAALPIRPAR